MKAARVTGSARASVWPLRAAAPRARQRSRRRLAALTAPPATAGSSSSLAAAGGAPPSPSPGSGRRRPAAAPATARPAFGAALGGRGRRRRGRSGHERARAAAAAHAGEVDGEARGVATRQPLDAADGRPQLRRCRRTEEARGRGAGSQLGIHTSTPRVGVVVVVAESRRLQPTMLPAFVAGLSMPRRPRPTHPRTSPAAGFVGGGTRDLGFRRDLLLSLAAAAARFGFAGPAAIAYPSAILGAALGFALGRRYPPCANSIGRSPTCRARGECGRRRCCRGDAAAVRCRPLLGSVLQISTHAAATAVGFVRLPLNVYVGAQAGPRGGGRRRRARRRRAAARRRARRRPIANKLLQRRRAAAAPRRPATRRREALGYAHTRGTFHTRGS